MATISQIQIGEQTYNIYDANAARTTNVNTIDGRLNTIEGYFTEGKLNLANGGTALNSSSQNVLLKALGLAKTANDTWNLGGVQIAGWVTDDRKQCRFTLIVPWHLYSIQSISLAGSATIIGHNGTYLFGTDSNSLVLGSSTVKDKSVDINNHKVTFHLGTSNNSAQGTAYAHTPCVAVLSNFVITFT